MKTISCSCLADDYQGLLLGTEGGNIYVLNVGSFSLSDQVVYQDIVMQKYVTEHTAVCCCATSVFVIVTGVTENAS